MKLTILNCAVLGGALCAAAAQQGGLDARGVEFRAAWRASCATLRAALPRPAVPASAPCVKLSTGIVALDTAVLDAPGWSIVSAETCADLGEAIVEEYLGDRTWLVRGAASSTLARAHGVAPLLPVYKVSPHVYDPGAYIPGDEPESREIDVHGFRTGSAGELEQAVRAQGGEILSVVHVIPAVICRVPLEAIATLAARDDVKWIGKTPPAMSAYNSNSRSVLGANTAHTAPYGYRGTNITVLVYDVGSANFHQDFTNRLVYVEKLGADSHSTHVAGTVLGDGRESGGTYRGMAPEARLLSYTYNYVTPVFYNNPGDLETNYFVAINTYSADLANNSIGINMAVPWYYGDYETSAILLDQITYGRLGRPY